MKLSTINQIVEAIISQTQSDVKLPHEDVREATFKRMANEATIILKTAMICESRGIDEAMKYYTGTHSEIEYKDFIERMSYVSNRNDIKEKWDESWRASERLGEVLKCAELNSTFTQRQTRK